VPTTALKPGFLLITNLTLYVMDQGEAEAWYCDVLGFVVRARARHRWPGSDHDGLWLTVSVKHDSAVVVSLAPVLTVADQALVGTMPPITIKTPDIEMEYGRLLSMGADLTPLEAHEWGPSFVVRDPSGNRWNVVHLP
jgi:uncharacterized glyoxalase superfamily protein PhnB